MHTVATGLLGSLPRCSTAFFTKWGMEVGSELEGGATVMGAVVVVVVLTTISATFSSRWLSPTVKLVKGPTWSVLLATEEVTGTVEFSPNPS